MTDIVVSAEFEPKRQNPQSVLEGVLVSKTYRFEKAYRKS